MECYSTATIEKQYCYIVKVNQILEEALVKLGGQEALKEIEGKYSLNEVPDLWEKVNNAN